MKLFRWLLILALTSPLMAQNVRFDLPITTVQASGGNLLPVYAIPGALISFYNEPAGTLASTYNSATSVSACPTGSQVVLNGSGACVSSADPYGNMGAWFQPGQYMATISSSGRNYNYYFTISGTSSSIGPGLENEIPYYAANGQSLTPNTNSTLNVAGDLTIQQLTDAGLTTGNCVQASAGGLLINAGGACTVSIPCSVSNIASTLTAAGAIPNSTINISGGCAAPYLISGGVVIAANFVNLNFNGAAIESTYTAGDSIVVSGNFDTFNQPIMIPGAASQYSAISDTGWGFTINGGGVQQLSGNYPNNGHYWYHNITYISDEQATLNSWNSQANFGLYGGSGGAEGTLRCDSTFCGAGLYNPAGAGNGAILASYGSTFSMGCSGNAIDWEGDNALYLNDITIQAYNQYGIRAATGANGAGTVHIKGIYNSNPPCGSNPTWTTGNPMLNNIQASVPFVFGPGVRVYVESPDTGYVNGGNLTVTCTSGTCTHTFGYYVVIHSNGASSTETVPVAIGQAYSVDPSFTSSSVSVLMPTSPGTGDTCDFLRVDLTANSIGPIYGNNSNTYLLNSGVACGPVAGNYITFTDTASAGTAYTWPAVVTPYGPELGQNGWPGMFMSLAGVNTNEATYTGSCPNVNYGIVIPAYAGAFNQTPVTCVTPTRDSGQGEYAITPMLNNRPSGYNYSSNLTSSIINPAWYKYTPAGLKGLYNLGPNNSTYTWEGGPTELFTFIDCNPFKTLATPGNHPSWDACDTYLGADQQQYGFALGDSHSISEYINTVPDGGSFYERLTASLKSIYAPTTIYNALSVNQIGGTITNGSNGTQAVGSLPATTEYFYVAQGFIAGGYHTNLSTEINITTGSGSANRNYFFNTFPAGVTYYNWYRSTSTGTEVGPCNAAPIPYTSGSIETVDSQVTCTGTAPTNTDTMPASPLTAQTINPGTKYSAAGTLLATCASGIDGKLAYVTDASALTPGTTYTPAAGASTVHVWVECVYSGSAYAWQTM